MRSPYCYYVSYQLAVFDYALRVTKQMSVYVCVCVFVVCDQSIILNGNESLLLFAVMSVQKRAIINNIMGGSELSRERRDLVSVVVDYMYARCEVG